MNDYAKALQVALENYRAYAEGLEVQLKMELAIANETITAERANTTSWMETAGSLSDKVRKLQEQLDNGDDETCYDYDDIEERYDDIDTREAY